MLLLGQSLHLLPIQSCHILLSMLTGSLVIMCNLIMEPMLRQSNLMCHSKVQHYLRNLRAPLPLHRVSPCSKSNPL